MRKSIITALVLSLAVNAGVLTALPLLGGALETALPAPRLLEVRDIDIVKVKKTFPVPMLPRVAKREEVRVKPASEPPSPVPKAPPERTAPSPVQPLSDLLKDIDIELGREALEPAVDLALPLTGVSGGLEGSDAAGAAPVEKVWSLDEVDRLPVKVCHVQPVYPQWALESGVEGMVTVSLVIGADGTVREVRVVRGSGYRDFDEAALAAVRLWRFAPALACDRAIAVRALQKIRFSLK